MSFKGAVKFATLTIVAGSAVTGSYVAVVTYTNPVVMFAVKNGSNGDVVFSIDGVNPIIGFPSSSGSAYDIQTNHPHVSDLMLQANTTLFIKQQGSAPGSPAGNIYIEAMQVIS